MLLRSAGLVLLYTIQVAFADGLSCNFKTPCCWKSLDENAKWQVRSARSININDYRRTFLVGRSRLPPVGNYIIQNGEKSPTSFGSCNFCSSDGEVNIQYRHWQSPTANMKLCWRRWDQPIHSENCHLAEPSRQSQIISQNLAVPAGEDIQVLFVMEKQERAINAIVMIDRIYLSVKKCDLANAQRTAGPTSREVRITTPHSMRNGEKSSRKGNRPSIENSHMSPPRRLDLLQLALVDERVRAKIMDRQQQREIIRQMLDNAVSSKRKDYKRQLKEGAGTKEANKSPPSSKNEQFARNLAASASFSSPIAIVSSVALRELPDHSSKRTLIELPRKFSSVSRRVPPPSPPAKTEDFDPLTDLLGKELVEFLDPNYVTVDDDEQDIAYEDKLRFR
uniref:MAM domain-containing protein n=1 Tax=Angiostrongylus cantonensis TaxID=6313 RepID=A0A0K0DD61_ANGCA